MTLQSVSKKRVDTLTLTNSILIWPQPVSSDLYRPANIVIRGTCRREGDMQPGYAKLHPFIWLIVTHGHVLKWTKIKKTSDMAMYKIYPRSRFTFYGGYTHSSFARTAYVYFKQNQRSVAGYIVCRRQFVWETEPIGVGPKCLCTAYLSCPYRKFSPVRCLFVYSRRNRYC